MYAEYNPNPKKRNTEDCVIRAITKILKMSWQEAYIELSLLGFKLSDMPTANHVWDRYMKDHGYVRKSLPDKCPDCYTVEDFCKDHPQGYFLLGTGSHAVAVVDGFYFDAWDSGNEVPLYFYERAEKK